MPVRKNSGRMNLLPQLSHWNAVELSDQRHLRHFEACRSYPRQDMCTAHAIFLVEKARFFEQIE
jgi:hypothetical protein